ncbi:MAG: hypothetical protein PVG14_06445 [Anaerolineales bacterium]
MPIPYAQRRQRRQQLLEELPPGLRGRIALRNVEAVAKLTPEAQQKLMEAIDAGARIPAAIRYTKENPEATVNEIVSKCHRKAGKRRQRAAAEKSVSSTPHDLNKLADLLQVCFPDMPRSTAKAMAGSELLSEVLSIVRAQRTCFESRHAESDFVVVVLCGLALRTIDRLNQIIPKRLIYRQALQQSGVKWPY